MISVVEEKLFVDRMKFASNRGFSFDVDDLRSIIFQIASDGRPTWNNRVPCDDTLRSFRARHPELKLRTYERKDAANFATENATHLQSLSSVLKAVERRNPGIFAAPRDLGM